MKSLHLEHIPDENWSEPTKWKLLDDFEHHDYIVPKGFVSDGITSPRFLYPFFNPTGLGLRAAIIHDYLLTKLSKYESRKTADIVFKKVLEDDGLGKYRVLMMYYSVRLYGMTKIYFSNWQDK